MTTKNKIHHIQREILKRLALSQGLRFKQLTINGYETEHANYHLQKLVDSGYITKHSQTYMLTNLGKYLVDSFDDDFVSLEKQAKVSVLIRVYRMDEVTNQNYQLVVRRLKNPYFGKIGRVGGKVLFGETFEEAARRELKEETGLEAITLNLRNIIHKV